MLWAGPDQADKAVNVACHTGPCLYFLLPDGPGRAVPGRVVNIKNVMGFWPGCHATSENMMGGTGRGPPSEDVMGRAEQWMGRADPPGSSPNAKQAISCPIRTGDISIYYGCGFVLLYLAFACQHKIIKISRDDTSMSILYLLT